MAFDAEILPIQQFLLDERPGGLRLQAERIAAQVDARLAVPVFRNVKFFAKCRERIVSIQFLREIQAGSVVHFELMLNGSEIF